MQVELIEEVFKKGHPKENFLLKIDAIRQKEIEREFLTLEEINGHFIRFKGMRIA